MKYNIWLIEVDGKFCNSIQYSVGFTNINEAYRALEILSYNWPKPHYVFEVREYL